LESTNTGRKKTSKLRVYVFYPQTQGIAVTTISPRGNTKTRVYSFTMDGYFDLPGPFRGNETGEVFYSIEDLLSRLALDPEPFVLQHFIAQYV